MGAIAPVPTSTLTGDDDFARRIATFGAIAPVPTSTLTGRRRRFRTPNRDLGCDRPGAGLDVDFGRMGIARDGFRLTDGLLRIAVDMTDGCDDAFIACS